MRGITRQAAVVAAALFNVVMNGLAGAGILFGRQTGAVSDAIQTEVTPAGWAFAIWSVIFVGVIVFAAWQAAPIRRGARYDGIGTPFVVANLLNGLWQIPWLLGYLGVAAVVIFGILLSLIWLYVKLDQMALRGPDRWALGVPTSLFLAWLTAAAPLNVTVWLASIGVAGGGISWGPILIVIVVAIGAWVLRNTADVAFALVLVWAFAGIAAKQWGDAPLIAALGVGIVVFAIVTAHALRRGLSPYPTAHGG